MEEIRRRTRQNEQERFDREVEDDFQTAIDEVDQIEIEVTPNDVEILSNGMDFWQHTILNHSEFEVVIRIRATSPSFFSISKNVFRLKKDELYTVTVARHPHPIRSHHLKLDVTKYLESFNPINLLDYFIGPYCWKTFVVRYHGAPRFWSDAMAVQDWMPDEEMSKKVETEMQLILAEEKESQREQYVDATEDIEPAKMNLTNVILMATEVSYGNELERDQNEREDEDYEDEMEDRKNC